jgi:uncharacterized RmlC-like cupin family protein
MWSMREPAHQHDEHESVAYVIEGEMVHPSSTRYRT